MIVYGSCCLLVQRLHQNDEQNPNIWCILWRLREAALQRRGQSITCTGTMKGRRECDVSGGPGMLKEDKVPAQPRSLSHHPAAGFISFAQQDRRFAFVPLRQVSLTGFVACCYMPSPLTVCIRLSAPKQWFSVLSCCFLKQKATCTNPHLVGLINLVNLLRVQGLMEIFQYCILLKTSFSGVLPSRE